MASFLNIVAIAAGGWESSSEHDDNVDILQNAMRSGFQILDGYQTHQDLTRRIQQLINNDPDNPCVAVLEVYHHGSPVSVDNMSAGDVVAWGASLMSLLSWCDEAKIYLSGCNTGLVDPIRPVGTGGPIAQQLAAAMPFNATTFANRIRVYGSAGYITGSHAGADEEIQSSYTEGALWWSIEHQAYPSSRSGTGGNVWNEFKNGTW